MWGVPCSYSRGGSRYGLFRPWPPPLLTAKSCKCSLFGATSANFPPISTLESRPPLVANPGSSPVFEQELLHNTVAAEKLQPGFVQSWKPGKSHGM